MDAVDERDEQDQARPAGAILDAPQPEHHGALVLLENPNRQRDTSSTTRGQRNNHIDDHVASFGTRMERPPAKPPTHKERGGPGDLLLNVRAFRTAAVVSAAESRIAAHISVVTAIATAVRKPPSCQPNSPCP